MKSQPKIVPLVKVQVVIKLIVLMKKGRTLEIKVEQIYRNNRNNREKVLIV